MLGKLSADLARSARHIIFPLGARSYGDLGNTLLTKRPFCGGRTEIDKINKQVSYHSYHHLNYYWHHMSSQSNGKELFELFPAPTSIHSTEFPVPRPLPGVTPSSTATLQEILHDDYKRFHCFFNYMGFHK